MVFADIMIDLCEHVSEAIHQSSVMKLCFSKVIYLLFVYDNYEYIIYYFTLYLLLSIVHRNNLLMSSKVE